MNSKDSTFTGLMQLTSMPWSQLLHNHNEQRRDALRSQRFYISPRNKERAFRAMLKILVWMCWRIIPNIITIFVHCLLQIQQSTFFWLIKRKSLISIKFPVFSDHYLRIKENFSNQKIRTLQTQHIGQFYPKNYVEANKVVIKRLLRFTLWKQFGSKIHQRRRFNKSFSDRLCIDLFFIMKISNNNIKILKWTHFGTRNFRNWLSIFKSVG